MPGMLGQRHFRDRSWLDAQLSAILNFWYPASIDRRHGGFLNLFAADGSVVDGEQKHLVASARFAVLYAMGALAGGGGDWCRQAAEDAVEFLWRCHRDPHHGGYYWVVRGDQPFDRRKRADGRKGDGLDPDYHPAGACFEALRCLDLNDRKQQEAGENVNVGDSA